MLMKEFIQLVDWIMIVQVFLLLTNDGDIYNKIIHPRVAIDKNI